MRKILLLISLILVYVGSVSAQKYSPYANRIRFVTSNPLICTPNTFYFNSISNQIIVCKTSSVWIGTAFNGSLSSGQFLAPNGTAALPSFSFTNDPDTGIFRSTANTLGFTTNGVEKWVINSSGAFNPILNNTYDIGNGSVNIRDINVGRSLVLYGSTSGNVNLRASAITTNYNLFWPVAQGAGFLTNDGSGNFNWTVNDFLSDFTTLFTNQTDNFIPRTNNNNTLEDSPIYADDNDIRIDSKSGTTVIGDYEQNNNNVRIQVDDFNRIIELKSTTGTEGSNKGIKLTNELAASVLFLDSTRFLNSIHLTDGQLLIGQTSGNPTAANITGSNGIVVSNGANSIDISLVDTPNSPIIAYQSSDYTNSTTTFSNTSLNVSISNGQKYSFILQVFASDSQAADGFKLDFNGGSATAINFIAGSNTSIVTGVTTTLAGTFNNGTLTGTNLITISGSLEASTSGTFIVRAAQNAHTTGTLTVLRGSNLILIKVV